MTRIERSGDLTHSQQRMWLRMTWREIGAPYAALRKQVDFAEPIPVDTVVGAWETLVARHEALRTVFTPGADSRPIQLVFAADGFQLPLTFDDESGLADYLSGRPTLLFSGVGVLTPLWQVRLFLRDGQVVSVCLTIEHIIIDGESVENWREQFLGLCHGREVPLPTTQPLDRQADEVLSRSRRRSTVGELFARSPGLLVPALVSEPPEERYFFLVKQFPGMVPQVDAICAANRVTRSTVFMYALGWLLARHSGRHSVVFSSLFANRLERDHSIECQMFPVEILVDLSADASIRQALRAAHAAALTGFAQHRSSALSTPFEADARETMNRGVGVFLPIMYDYIPDVPVGLDEMDEREEWESEGEPFGHMYYVYQSGPDFVIGLDSDTVMFPVPVIRQFAEVLPRFIAFLAGDGDTRIGGADALLPDDFRFTPDGHLVGQDWVRPETVRRLLLEAPHVRDAKVTVDDGELSAWLTLEPGGDVYDVHESLLSRLFEHSDAKAPSRYVLAGETAREWRPRVALPERAPVTRAEKELCEAIRETHGRVVTNLAQTYLEAGGDLLRTAALVQALRRRGLTGLRPEHFRSPFPLRAVARALRPGEGR
ncbi:condensation domain-containing protein [Actinoplanes derwentensis]|uniref:Condensation domain-containing protein n=1 Tax=Actinoplanes derwentensis TaxID=113562 RepID=A0A1H2CIX6_9ACTN|nr:condensation domain-containing protein [Actinoplanes derwentensis]GID89583.1 hypothetical protein Ade03nite_85070 [Actinoplanes derwentensis]SDT70197.1 Condensation domain-containing protein [Actinoplanes derwentensis]